ncbi:MAG: deoxyribose-phosphate aldolase [Anaerolineaceae bacterium]|jgi:deoxyribose-phosphate aldolase
MTTKPSLSLPANFPSLIDVSVHRPNTTLSEIKAMCETGLQEGFNVISNSCFIPQARQFLGLDAKIKLGSTVGFPFGTASTQAKAAEARIAIENGAQEIDMVIAIGFLREGIQHYSTVEKDIKAVVDAVKTAGGGVVKVIIETCYLTRDQIIDACKIVGNAGADFVKSSTGYGPAGATLENLKLMREVTDPSVEVKAAGGIRTLAQCIEYLDLGVTRLGIGLTGALPILEDYRNNVIIDRQTQSDLDY